MNKERELWQFVESHLTIGEPLMLLIVAASSGSSPGRAGYKMAVAVDGELCGSIGGGVMEVRLVEQAKKLLSGPRAITTGFRHAVLNEQIHQKNAKNPSGMICSGRQTVIIRQLTFDDMDTVVSIVEGLNQQKVAAFEISNSKFQIVENTRDRSRLYFSKTSETEYRYQEMLGSENRLFIIGGGHCALALSKLMSRLDFHITIVDDRPKLNTIGKNEFADTIAIIDGYESIGGHVPPSEDSYVVVMTLGYASDAVVIRQLLDREFKYFGVLGSKTKMKALLSQLKKEGCSNERLARIHTPIGLPINSRTPEEIAISIAAEIISVKNSTL